MAPQARRGGNTSPGPDGALVIDKPRGLSSHDVVAAVRRALGERRIGHTGTLDPLATGVLPLLLGRSTRLARFLTAADKTYEALVRFGWATDSDDETGAPITPRTSVRLDASEVERALASLRGTILQQPPAFSAKRVGGRRAYELARAAGSPVLTPVPVTVHRLELVEIRGDAAVLFVECSAGCYVRALARDAGHSLGVGAHVAGLRRLASGRFRLDQALPLDAVLRDPAGTLSHVLPPAQVMEDVPAAHLTWRDVERVKHGAEIEAAAGAVVPGGTDAFVRLVDPEGRLVAMARTRSGSGALHPIVVLV